MCINMCGSMLKVTIRIAQPYLRDEDGVDEVLRGEVAACTLPLPQNLVMIARMKSHSRVHLLTQQFVSGAQKGKKKVELGPDASFRN